MADLQSATYASGDKVVIPTSFLDSFSWGYCASPATRSDVNLSPSEIGRNESIEARMGIGAGYSMGIGANSVFLADITSVEYSAGGSDTPAGYSQNTRERHAFELNGLKKDLTADTSLKATYISQDDFSLNVSSAYKVSDDAASLLLNSKYEMSSLGTYNSGSGSISRGDIVTLSGGSTDGLPHVETADGSAITSALGIALESVSSSSVLSVMHLDPGKLIVAGNVSASVGDRFYVSSSGELNTSDTTNFSVGTLAAAGSSDQVMLVQVDYSF